MFCYIEGENKGNIESSRVSQTLRRRIVEETSRVVGYIRHYVQQWSAYKYNKSEGKFTCLAIASTTCYRLLQL